MDQREALIIVRETFFHRTPNIDATLRLETELAEKLIASAAEHDTEVQIFPSGSPSNFRDFRHPVKVVIPEGYMELKFSLQGKDALPLLGDIFERTRNQANQK